MLPSEKQLSSKATTDSFDEIYTNYDLSVNDVYRADSGYPFDYPTRWLNDPSMNKRIAIRRLDVTPTTHSITLTLTALDVFDIVNPYPEEEEIEGAPMENFKMTQIIDITEYDNLIKVLNGMCNSFSYPAESGLSGGLRYEYDDEKNQLKLKFINFRGVSVKFEFTDNPLNDITDSNDNIKSFLRFLNQEESKKNIEKITSDIKEKVFDQVWNRDRLYFHSSFSTSRRHFIGKRGDFYQNLTLLYPPPTNESTFFIRFTSNGFKNILLRYCLFDIQLCYIVNYRKATIL